MFQDEHIRWLQELIGAGHPVPFELLSLLGDTWGVLLAVGLARWLYGRRAAFTTAAAAAVAAPVWLALATLFAVPRPAGSGIEVHAQLASGSFPSGHVFHAGVIWGTLAAITPMPLAVPIIAASLTAVARVYLGAHYPVDVLASLALAPGFIWVFLRTKAWLDPRVSRLAVRLLLAAIPVAAVVALILGLRPERLRRAEVAGMILATPIAVLWAMRRGDRPVRRTGRIQLVAGGLAGLVGLALVSRLLGAGRLWLGTAATAVGCLWVIRVAPELLLRPRTGAP